MSQTLKKFWGHIAFTMSVHPSIHYKNLVGSVVECFTQDRGDAFSSLTSVTVLCP